MAKSRKTTASKTNNNNAVNTATVTVAEHSAPDTGIGWLVPVGFVIRSEVQLDAKKTDTKTARLVMQREYARWKHAVLAALTAAGIPIVPNFFETTDPYTGDMNTGLGGRPENDVAAFDALLSGSSDTPTGTAETDESSDEYAAMNVTQLRAAAKAAGLKTAGTKEVLVKRLRAQNAA